MLSERHHLRQHGALQLPPSLRTKVIPVFLQILNLQLVLALSEDGLRVLLKAPRQDATLPVPDINPSVSIHNS